MSGQRRFVVATRGGSAARFPADGDLLVIEASTAVGPATCTFRTRYSDEGLASPIPREMWVDVRGEAACTLDEAINAYIAAVNSLAPLIALSANAPVGDLDVTLGYDDTQGTNGHEFFENFLPEERGLPRHGRRVDVPATVSLLDAINQSPESNRLIRALAQYREALNHWRKGRETFVASHLWMAVEALTKAALRRALAQESCATDDELVSLWHLEDKRALDGEVRRRLIFHGDRDTMANLKRASDGFEHGFLGFEEVLRLARTVRDEAAQHIRSAILELAGLPIAASGALTTGQYAKVQASWPLVRYVRGELIGESGNMAAPDQEYPILYWEQRLKSYERNPDGTAAMSFEDKLTLKGAEGIEFRPRSIEVWGPESDPLPAPSGPVNPSDGETTAEPS